jgi:serine/threonine protein kinase
MPGLQTRDDLFSLVLPFRLYSLFDRCLVKNPDERATATELLQHEFILAAKPASILSQMIAEAREIRENLVYRLSEKHLVDSVSFNDRFRDLIDVADQQNWKYSAGR